MKPLSFTCLPVLLLMACLCANLPAMPQNVGVGTNNPTTKLHIKEDADAPTTLTIENTQMGTNAGQLLSFADQDGPLAGLLMRNLGGAESNGMYFFNNRPSGHFRFRTGGSTRLYLANNGNIAIGTNFTDPDGLLHLKGVEWNARLAIFESHDATMVGPGLRFSNTNYSYDIIGATGQQAGVGANHFAIWDNTASKYRLTIAPDGSTSIGGTAPSASYRLWVQTVDNTYAGFFSNSFSGNSSRTALFALSNNAAGYGVGIRAEGGSMGALLESNAPGFNGSTYGVYGNAKGAGGVGVHYGVYGFASGGGVNWAGYFNGNVHVTGILSKAAGTFKIDHPQDPENKYLSHSFVESPDMMNVYTGTVTTNAAGEAIAQLPAYFEALNIQYTYQLTVVGQFAQAIVLKEIAGNQFTIKTDKPTVKVSWLVTGVRNDPFAQANRVVPVQEKPADEKGKYLYPEGYRQPTEKSIVPPLNIEPVKE